MTQDPIVSELRKKGVHVLNTVDLPEAFKGKVMRGETSSNRRVNIAPQHPIGIYDIDALERFLESLQAGEKRFPSRIREFFHQERARLYLGVLEHLEILDPAKFAASVPKYLRDGNSGLYLTTLVVAFPSERLYQIVAGENESSADSYRRGLSTHSPYIDLEILRKNHHEYRRHQ